MPEAGSDHDERIHRINAELQGPTQDKEAGGGYLLIQEFDNYIRQKMLDFYRIGFRVTRPS